MMRLPIWWTLCASKSEVDVALVRVNSPTVATSRSNRMQCCKKSMTCFAQREKPQARSCHESQGIDPGRVRARVHALSHPCRAHPAPSWRPGCAAAGRGARRTPPPPPQSRQSPRPDQTRPCMHPAKRRGMKGSRFSARSVEAVGVWWETTEGSRLIRGCHALKKRRGAGHLRARLGSQRQT
eukprot:2516884-Pleurochrysis_carterae.AAC.4